jgi:hypothetical protein
VQKPTHSAKSRKPAFRGEFHSDPPSVRTSPGRNTLTKRYVEKCHKRFDADEAEALLDAIDGCARSGMALPLWAAKAFCERYVSWAQFEAGTLDEAFGVRRKGMHVARRNQRERLRLHVALLVIQLHEEGMPIDDVLFDQVGADLGIKGPTAKDIYYEPATKLWLKLLPNFEIS